MIGPKLDARSYAILILAVVGVLLGANLIAQNDRKFVPQDTAEVASATQAVASATQEVAASNREIAVAIKDLASALREFNSVYAQANKASVPDNASDEETMMITPSDPDEGVFELN